MMVTDVTRAAHVLSGRPAADARPCLVCISNTGWFEDYPTNREQIMLRLSKHMRVLVVEAPESLVARLSNRSTHRKRARGLRRRSSNLWLLNPIALIPGPLTRRSSRLANLNDWLVRLSVRWAVARLGFRRPFLWIYGADGGQYLTALGERRSVYHCVDDYEAARQYMYPDRRRCYEGKYGEEYLVRHVDDVIVTSPHLLAKMRPLNERTTLMTNVADVELFERANDPHLAPAPESLSWSRPVIGYVGALDSYKVDFPLMDALAAAHPDWTFVCIGPVGVAARTAEHDLPSRPNILYLGERPQSQLPSYVKAFDVAIIPYNLNDYTRGVFPLKFFEYLAAGKPVVTTPLPALAAYEKVAHFAADAASFAHAVEHALAHRDGVAAAERIRIARQHSWDGRVRQILALLEDQECCPEDGLHNGH